VVQKKSQVYSFQFWWFFLNSINHKIILSNCQMSITHEQLTIYSSYIWLQGLSWLSSSSYGSWIYNYGLCNQYISPLKLWIRVLLRRGVHDTTLYDKAWQRLATGLWISLGTLVSSTTKTDCHDIAEILLKVALNTITKYMYMYTIT
jgi:hypothetical protein